MRFGSKNCFVFSFSITSSRRYFQQVLNLYKAITLFEHYRPAVTLNSFYLSRKEFYILVKEKQTSFSIYLEHHGNHLQSW